MPVPMLATVDSIALLGAVGEMNLSHPKLPDLPPPECWAHRPLLLRLAAQQRLAKESLFSEAEGLKESPIVGTPLPVNIPFPFESDLFAGTAIVRILDCPGAEECKYYTGSRRNRRLQMSIQGQVKRPISFDDIICGDELSRPLSHMPPGWLISLGLGVVRLLAPGVRYNVNSATPYALAPTVAVANNFRVDTKGTQPSILEEIFEETSLLGGMFAEREVSASERCKFFSSAENLKDFTMQPNYVYTFDFHQSILNAVEFTMEFTRWVSVDLSWHLNGQPIHFMSRTLDGQYLWNLELWHEKLLKDLPPPELEQEYTNTPKPKHELDAQGKKKWPVVHQ